MGAEELLVAARRASGLSQEELAVRASTSRPTLSAYEPLMSMDVSLRRWKTATRLLAAAGFELAIQPRVSFTEHRTSGGRRVPVPSSLPRLAPERALATVTLPLHLTWSHPDRRFSLRDRQDRARVYEIVLREGGPEDVLAYVDGVLLVDLWDELVLPRDIRAAWGDLIEDARRVAA